MLLFIYLMVTWESLLRPADTEVTSLFLAYTAKLFPDIFCFMFLDDAVFFYFVSHKETRGSWTEPCVRPWPEDGADDVYPVFLSGQESRSQQTGLLFTPNDKLDRVSRSETVNYCTGIQ
jgi:hypothetical protein